jgi:enoyl-CoA hydratase/carnithine racemase
MYGMYASYPNLLAAWYILASVLGTWNLVPELPEVRVGSFPGGVARWVALLGIFAVLRVGDPVDLALFHDSRFTIHISWLVVCVN